MGVLVDRFLFNDTLAHHFKHSGTVIFWTMPKIFRHHRRNSIPIEQRLSQPRILRDRNGRKIQKTAQIAFLSLLRKWHQKSKSRHLRVASLCSESNTSYLWPQSLSSASSARRFRARMSFTLCSHRVICVSLTKPTTTRLLSGLNGIERDEV